MKYFIQIFIYVVYSLVGFGQGNNIELKKKLDEINEYKKSIDTNSNKYREEFDTKKIKNFEQEERSWKAYNLKENIKSNEPLRIKYTEFGTKENIQINLYYKNGILVFAEYVAYEKQKNIKSFFNESRFYFWNSALIDKKGNLKLELSELLSKEKMIKAFFYSETN